MGLFDKLKGAVNAVTGGAAKVTLQLDAATTASGKSVEAIVTATSTGGELKSGGVFVDLEGEEVVTIKDEDGRAQSFRAQTYSNKVQIAPAFVLAPGETQQFRGKITIPPNVQPTYRGRQAQHEWRVRGRIEAFGNDPDSGFQTLTVNANA